MDPRHPARLHPDKEELPPERADLSCPYQSHAVIQLLQRQAAGAGNPPQRCRAESLSCGFSRPTRLQFGSDKHSQIRLSPCTKTAMLTMTRVAAQQCSTCGRQWI